MKNETADLHPSLGIAMGTLNTCLLMLAVVLSLHLTDELAGFLGGLDSAIGLGLFALLWSVTTYCTYRGWAETAPEGLDDRIGARFLEASARWGFMGGIAIFLTGLLAFVLVASFLVMTEAEEGSVLATWIFAVLAGFFGSAVAGAVGVVFGVVFATIDVLMAKLVLAMLRTGAAA